MKLPKIKFGPNNIIMCPGLSSIIFCPPIFWYIFFFGVQAADGGLDFKVIPPTASPSEQSTSTGKENQNKQKISKIFINMHNNISLNLSHIILKLFDIYVIFGKPNQHENTFTKIFLSLVTLLN